MQTSDVLREGETAKTLEVFTLRRFPFVPNAFEPALLYSNPTVVSELSESNRLVIGATFVGRAVNLSKVENFRRAHTQQSKTKSKGDRRRKKA